MSALLARLSGLDASPPVVPSPKGQDRFWFTGLLLVIVALAVTVTLFLYEAPWDIDNGSYVNLALGQVSEVYRPYANRMLHPLMVRGVAAALGTQPSVGSSAWWIVQIAFLAAFMVGAVALVARLLYRADASPSWVARNFAYALLLLVSPLWCVWGGNPYIQDVPVAAFGIFFFHALIGGRMAVALACLALMVLTRESSVVVAATLFFCAACARRWKLAAGTCLVTAGAMAFSAWLGRESPGSVSGMGSFSYMATKTLAAGCYNLLGIHLWTDMHAVKLPWFYPDAPAWSMDLPAWVRLGGVRSVGIYTFDPLHVMNTLALWVLPLVPPALVLFLSRRMASLRTLLSPRSLPLAVQVAALSGLLFWLSQPFAGYSPWRYLGYIWPFAWIVVPWLIRSQIRK